MVRRRPRDAGKRPGRSGRGVQGRILADRAGIRGILPWRRGGGKQNPRIVAERDQAQKRSSRSEDSRRNRAGLAALRRWRWANFQRSGGRRGSKRRVCHRRPGLGSSRQDLAQGESTLPRTGRTASGRDASQGRSSRMGSPPPLPKESFHFGAAAQDASIS